MSVHRVSSPRARTVPLAVYSKHTMQAAHGLGPFVDEMLAPGTFGALAPGTRALLLSRLPQVVRWRALGWAIHVWGPGVKGSCGAV